ncbi:MAG: FMN-binding negative transcriptional regulator [Alphaproteobacteria bacterium]|nr:MAG: FMN-binding negative transcriptional regulator [Alphaproteobacteria bacterium]
MHPHPKFAMVAREEMAALVRSEGFGTVTVQTEEGLRAVHVPVLLDGETLRFHVGRGNKVHMALMAGAEALAVVNGPHAYVSPDWYGMQGRVPTWNYVAVELNGPVRALDDGELVALLDAISEENEARLAPKPVWTREQMGADVFDGLLKRISGFEMAISEWRGTAKIDQDKPAEVRARIAEALEARGEAAMAALHRR